MKYTYVHHLNYCHWQIPGGGELGWPSIQNECFLIHITSNKDTAVASYCLE